MEDQFPSLHQCSEPEAYVCQACDTQFFYLKPTKLICPTCKTTDDDYLIPVKELEMEEARDI